jgi:hypothetical protein
MGGPYIELIPHLLHSIFQQNGDGPILDSSIDIGVVVGSELCRDRSRTDRPTGFFPKSMIKRTPKTDESPYKPSSVVDTVDRIDPALVA